jgi:hypothetical protein
MEPEHHSDWRLRVLTTHLIAMLKDQWVENEEQNLIFDLETYRKDLGESDPETARWFERLTADDRKEFLKQIALIETIAQGILWAMDHLTDLDELSPRLGDLE